MQILHNNSFLFYFYFIYLQVEVQCTTRIQCLHRLSYLQKDFEKNHGRSVECNEGDQTYIFFGLSNWFRMLV